MTAHGVCELIDIAVVELSSFLSRRDHESASTY